MQDRAWEKRKLLEEKHDGKKTDSFFADCRHLESGEPLAYIIGSVPFLNTTIHLDSHPLIPRPETEHWVENAIRDMQERGLEKPGVLDLCAGSGCIGVTVLKQVMNTTVAFVEIDEHHHETIQKNIEVNSIDPKRARVIGGSLFENVSGTYDFILSNPPYVDPALDRVEGSVKMHEPPEALYGGQDGLELISAIIQSAPRYLTQTGCLYLEHEPEHVAHIHKLGTRSGFHVSIHTDQYGRERYTQFVKTDV